MLILENIHKTYFTRTSETKVINGISLTVKKGQVFGFLGPNGAGKTTTVKMIVGLLFPDSGTSTVQNLPSDSLEAKRLIGFMPENPQFYNHLNAAEVMDFAGNLFDLDEKIIKKRTKDLLQKVGLGSSSKLPVRKFSKGMLQRLAFAVALINEPKLLVLDEPLDGLDPLGRLDFKKLLLDLKRRGATIFFSSHILADVEEICDEIAILNNGKIIRQGMPKKLIGSSYKTLEEMFVETIRYDD
ncbi:hypothetical protein A3A71_03835 [Candidatus Berkelbacteria bacterium RIFCSPLOWO2_01_FULL_50_28]|uniref:ABC transporter domain-containing protein n=1 Tax=Candidatus Berkelbacteria bacterium RIFCSPLOWO2_01_FULL_50_28 TaxID=1797471 RepID=A0A1F5EA65_9BACT|nr:MAG: hypothetical protein A3F39_01200 [Candidatus Berkelbacteria bacterium RIFCSPHIGHO2_12_FULL_50_11]OGD64278.1 MAG: hypothetical protein A3A71_03835 [Candidatus Berkelbacteria bacterium RIFCSPLOWO2_01_FULL_50_28]